MDKVIISDYIPTGKENAITRQELVRRTGLSDRVARQKIETERKNGVPIMSSSYHCGYWIATNASEIKEFCNEMRHRAKEMTYIAETIERGIV